MQSQQLSNLVSIGITTKNRWQDLHNTLTKIIEAGLDDLPIIIFDDGSDLTCPFDLTSLTFNQLELKRFDHSAGLIVRRNQIAQTIKTKYYLSFDDDSFPVAGSLLDAVKFAETCDNLLCLSFPIYNPVRHQYENSSTQQQPHQVKCFVGCGHLLHRQRFLDLGGYREELIHQGEEMEIAARAFQQDLYCYHFPYFLIHHIASNYGRNWWRMDFYGSRNNVFWNDWFVPEQLKVIKQIKTLIARILHSGKVCRLGVMQGQLAGFLQLSQYKENRQRMSMAFFEQWRSLPHS